MKKLAMISAFAAAGLAAAGAAFAGDEPGRDSGRWDKLDANGDGEISLSEMSEQQRAFFAAADADGNGAISKEEMKAHHQKKRAEMRAQHFGDKNGDGVIDRSEYDAAAAERFAKLDANSDGVISEDEIKAGHRGKRGHRGDRHKDD